MAYLKVVRGVAVPHVFPDDAVVSGLSYKGRAGEVYVTTYPKCGTTWVQYIAYGIFHDGQPPTDFVQFFRHSPFLELFGVDALGAMHGSGTIKTHLPFTDRRVSSEAKYIYVAQNPYDVCVSSYHQARTHTINADDVGDFGEYLRRFIGGAVSYGDYLEGSLLPWYSRRNENNVLFLTYEDLCAETVLQVKRIAEFIGKEYGQRIQRDSTMLQRVLAMSSKDQMRPIFRDYSRQVFQFLVQQRASRNVPISPELQDFVKFLNDRPPRHEFIRSAAVGDNETFFTEADKVSLGNWISSKTLGSDVMSLWPGICLP
ncbi:sulfotransferase 1 family member D1-like [Dermacentor albipictus]|uniref:sulfotransferase 1 family member D1-like n=1 Tax=Dermacentor albipictus TaxID=60249 RepID=UPI0031FCA42C